MNPFSRLTPGIRRIVGAAAILTAVVFIYWPSINGEFLLDDDILLTRSALIHAPDGLYRFWLTREPIDYYPVSNSALWLEWRLWGMDPTGYHVASVLFHLVSVFLLWAILLRLAVPGAFFAAFLFAVHPVNVESVAWIAQHKGMLALMFSLLSAYCLLRDESPPASATRPEEKTAKGQKRGRHFDESTPVRSAVGTSGWYWLALAAGLLGMLSKSSLAVLPVLLLLVLAWDRPLRRRDFIRLSPWMISGIVIAAVNVWFKTRESGFRDAGLVERLLGAAGTVWFYLYKALWPLDLAFIYPQWHIDVGSWRWWLPLIAALAMTGLLVAFHRRWSRPLLFAWLYFLTALVPVMGFTDVGYMKQSLVADHYQHAALVAVVTLVAAGAAVLARRAAPDAFSPAWAVAIALGLGMTWLARAQAALYAGPLTLYPAAIERNPEQWLAHVKLASALAEQGKWNEAIDNYEAALKVDPEYAEAHANLALALMRVGRLPEALEHGNEALRLRPGWPQVHVNLGAILLTAGRPDEAMAHYEEALKLDPDSPDAHYNRAVLLTLANQPAAAIADFQQAQRWWPDRADLQQNLGIAFVKLNRLPEAEAALRESVRLAPRSPEARYNLGLVLAASGKKEEAVLHYETAITLRPDYEAAQRNLEALLKEQYGG